MDVSGPLHNDSQTIPKIAKRFFDLVTWSLHVVQADNEVFDNRLKVDFARRMEGRHPAFLPVSTKLVTFYSILLSTDLLSIDENIDSKPVDAFTHAVNERFRLVNNVLGRTAGRAHRLQAQHLILRGSRYLEKRYFQMP